MRTSRVLAALLIGVLVLSSTAVPQAIKGGWNNAWVDATSEGVKVETGKRNGFQLGGSVSVADFLYGKLAIELEGLYSTKGFSVTDEGTRSTVDLAYIDVPILLALRIPLNEFAVGPRIYAGPTLSFEVGCNTGVAADSTASPPVIPMRTGFFTCDDTDIVDLGLKAGVGFQGYFFTADVALTWGISSTYESTNLSIKNRVVSITIGLGRP